ncbi:hypothetical protein [Cellulomonas sp. ICMP 17802]|uniref:hypothetical protein n=1 Tax=Cellulomonas sp. ICMP 17802 TaxID=3239199 RepID=UPI00351B00D5
MRRWEWRPLVGFAVGVAGGWAFGLSVPSALLVGLLGVAGVLLLTRLDGTPDPGWDRERYDRRHGARGEVQDLAWAMVARDGRVGERVLRRLKEVARHRLARHGLTLEEAEDLVGPRAYRTLTRARSPLPTLADVRHTLDVLDSLGPRRTTPTDDQPDDEPGSLQP